MVESLRFASGDGVVLEGELAEPAAASAGFVLCHPHPLHGGTMRSIVISALFEALPAHGIACVRFNFRGVQGSEGEHSGGDLERLDAKAALALLVQRTPSDLPIVMAGWSFGADVALSVGAERLAGWFAVAPPMRFGLDLAAWNGHDPRPKELALAEHDQFRPADEVREIVKDWRETTVEVVGGADHFFIGRTDRLVTLALAFAQRF